MHLVLRLKRITEHEPQAGRVCYLWGAGLEAPVLGYRSYSGAFCRQRDPRAAYVNSGGEADQVLHPSWYAPVPWDDLRRVFAEIKTGPVSGAPTGPEDEGERQ